MNDILKSILEKMSGDNKSGKVKGVMVIKKKEDDGADDALKSASEEALKAIKDDDSDAFASAIKAMVDVCNSCEEDGEEESEEEDD